MKKMTLAEFNAHLSSPVEQLAAGEPIAIIDKRDEIIGYFLPQIAPAQPKRKLGILEGKSTVVFHSDFKITENEFLGL